MDELSRLKAQIRKVYGWKSPSIEAELDRLEERIRTEERKLFAPLMVRAILEQLNLPTTQVNSVKDNESRSTSDVVAEQPCGQNHHRQKA